VNEFTPKPIVNNEDDRPWRDEEQGFGPEGDNFVVCVANYASWGYFEEALKAPLSQLTGQAG